MIIVDGGIWSKKQICSYESHTKFVVAYVEYFENSSFEEELGWKLFEFVVAQIEVAKILGDWYDLDRDL